MVGGRNGHSIAHTDGGEARVKSCGSCGAEVAERALFCTQCGTALAPVDADDAPETGATDEASSPSRHPFAPPSTADEPRDVEPQPAGPDASSQDLVGDRDDPPVGPETLPPPAWGVPSGPFEPSSGSSERAGSGRPATYAGVLVPPDPGSRPRRIGLTALAVLVVVALAAGAVMLVLAVRGDSKDEATNPLVADVVDGLPNGRASQKSLAVGDQTTVMVRNGFAVIEIEAEGPTEARVTAPGAVVVIAPADPEAGSGGKEPSEPVDATKGVTSLAAGRTRVLVIAKGAKKKRKKIEITTAEVTRKDLPTNNLVEVDLTKDAPVLDVAFSPGGDHAWNLVDEGSDGIKAVVYDVTESAEMGVSGGEVVCDLDKIACAVTAEHDYVLRVSAAKAPAKVKLTFEDQPPTGGPGSVTFDGEDAPFGGEVSAGKSITYELVVGPPDGVIVTVAPIGPGAWDPEIKLDGKLVSDQGLTIPEVVPVDAGLRRSFTVGGGKVGGGYVVTVERP